MTLTEEQAKQKVCHKTLTASLMSVEMTGSPCLGSLCMAWRWHYSPEEARANKNEPLGYCGLATEPRK